MKKLDYREIEKKVKCAWTNYISEEYLAQVINQMVNFKYKEGVDILVVEEDEYSSFGRSIELGGIVLDINKEGGFLGVEIIDASEKTPLTREDLKNIDNAEIRYTKDEEKIKVELDLTIQGRKNTITSQYPAKATA